MLHSRLLSPREEAGEAVVQRENSRKPSNQALVDDWARQWSTQLQRFLSQRLPSDADVQDLAQEVYLRLLRFDGVDLVRNPRAYICKMASHVVSEWKLEARQRMPHSSQALESLQTDEDLEAAIDMDRRRQDLRRALEGLPPAMRTALMLHHRDGLSYQQVAQEMGVSLRMVRRYIEEGYVRLRMRCRPGRAASGRGG